MKKQKKPVPPAEAEPVIKKQPFLKRLLFGPERPDISELEAGSTTILDILSPTAIDTKSRDYIVVDGVFHAYLYITGYGYSTTVGSCWLAPLVEAGEGVNISFSFTRQNRERSSPKLHRPPCSTAAECGMWAIPARTMRSWTVPSPPVST